MSATPIRIVWAIGGLCLLAGTVLAGAGFAGTWTMQASGGSLTLTFQEDAQGQLAGTLTGGTGYQLRLEGQIEEGVGVGVCRDEQGAVFFEAHLAGDRLELYLIEPDANNMPDSNRARRLAFVRQGGGGLATPPASPAPPPGTPSAPGQGRLTIPGAPLGGPSGGGAPPPTGPPAASPSGGPRVSDPALGISFVPPSGWKTQKTQQGYILGHDRLPGFIAILPHGLGSLEQMRAEASQGLVDAGSGMQLMPAGDFQIVGHNGLAGEYSGTIQGQAARAYAIGLISPGGGGISILTAAAASAWTPEYPRFVQSIAASVTFAPASAQNDLMQWIAGKYWSYRSSGGYSSERTVHLCPDGRYFDSAETSASGSFDNRASGSDWGTASQSQGVARWSIRGTRQQGVITIIYPDGTRTEVTYTATGEKGVFDIDGRKFAYAGAPNCN